MTAPVIGPLLDRAPCGYVSFGDDGIVETVNATLLAMLGYAREEVAGAHVQQLLTVGSRVFYQTHLFPLVRLHGVAEEIFLLLRAKSGYEVPVLFNATRQEQNGRPVMSAVLMHVRERQKFEDALLRAKRAAEDAQAAVERRERELQRANAQLEEQALEMELSEQQLQEQAAELEAQAEELRTVNDELQARGEELERQRSIADEANRAKSTFLAVMSHELRTPLNAIGGYVQLLEMGIHGPITAPQAEALGRVTRSQRHLLRLINDILNLARLESGRAEYDIARIALRSVVDAVMPMIEPQLIARQLACEVAVPEELTASADRDKAEQILLNLLSNASKFTPAGGRVKVEAIAEPAPPARVRLRVIDSGMGIPSARLREVFDPFVWVDVSHTRQTEGSGLGLAISRDLARGMGGELEVESEVGVGSTFSLILPAG